jgi:hypothetical protein
MTTLPKAVLIESFCGTARLVEGTGGTAGPLIVRGEFARVGHPTQNRRVYPAPIWESELQRLKTPLEDRRWYGELDHPEDGKTKLARSSHIVRRLWVEGDRVMGEAEILNTDAGRNLRAIIEANCPVGVSSRGYGDVVADQQGNHIVQEGFRLDAFDFVADPADATAFPRVVAESVDTTKPLVFESAPLHEAEAVPPPENASPATPADTNLVDQLAAKLLARLRAGAPVPAPTPSQAATVESTPQSAPASTASSIQESAMHRLEEENRMLRRQTVDAGCVLLASRMVQEEPDHETVLQLMGSVALYESIDSYNTRLTEIRAVVGGLRARHEEQARKAEGRLTEATARLREAVQERDQMHEQLERAVTLVQEARLRLLAERRLANHPQAAHIRQILDMTTLADEAHVDTIIDQFRAQRRTVLESDRAADRIRDTLLQGRGSNASALDEETPWGGPSKNQSAETDPVLRLMRTTQRLMPSGL